MPDPDAAFAPSKGQRAAVSQALRVFVVDDRGRRLAAGGLVRWLRRVAPARAKGIISVALISDARMRALNRTYRRKNYATDVLSFPSSPGRSPRVPQSPGPLTFLGDIVIARGVARRHLRNGTMWANIADSAGFLRGSMAIRPTTY